MGRACLPEWIRNPSGKKEIITHIPKWPVVRVFVCISGPTHYRKCTSWITAKEHMHSNAVDRDSVVFKTLTFTVVVCNVVRCINVI